MLNGKIGKRSLNGPLGLKKEKKVRQGGIYLPQHGITKKIVRLCLRDFLVLLRSCWVNNTFRNRIGKNQEGEYCFFKIYAT